MLIVLSMCFVIVYIGRRALSPLLPTIIGDLSITLLEASIALSLAAGSFAVFNILATEYLIT